MKGSELVKNVLKEGGNIESGWWIIEDILKDKDVVSSDWLERLESHHKTFPQEDDDEFADYDIPDEFYVAYGTAVNKWFEEFDRLMEELKN